MLASHLHVPRRRRLEGRGGWSLRAVPADQTPVTKDQLNSITFDSTDQALDVYEYIIRAVSVRTKLAFLADLLSKIQAAPVVNTVFSGDPNGQNYEQALQAANDAFMGLMQPNAFQNLQLVRNQLEVNVLPKNFATGVKVRLPSYQSGQAQLSYSDVLIQMPYVQDYGDLSQTSLLDDMTRMQQLGTLIDPSTQLSMVGLPIVIAIVIGVWGMLAGIWAIIRQYQAPQSKIVDLLSQAKAQGADITVLSDLLTRVQQSGSILNEASSVLKWGAIALGVGVVGYAAWHLLNNS